MSAPRFDLLGIGNAIVDVVAPCEPAFLSRHDMRPGAMALISSEQAAALYGTMPPGQESSGGSVANTCAVAANLGARVAFLGKVADDPLGRAFRRDIAAAGVHFPTEALRDGAATARCLILVTPDAERTLNTFLGAAAEFGSEDVSGDLVADAQITYLEGYLWDQPRAKEAFRLAARLAHQAGQRVARGARRAGSAQLAGPPGAVLEIGHFRSHQGSPRPCSAHGRRGHWRGLPPVRGHAGARSAAPCPAEDSTPTSE